MLVRHNENDPTAEHVNRAQNFFEVLLRILGTWIEETVVLRYFLIRLMRSVDL